jgi:hypothetical protein
MCVCVCMHMHMHEHVKKAQLVSTKICINGRLNSCGRKKRPHTQSRTTPSGGNACIPSESNTQTKSCGCWRRVLLTETAFLHLSTIHVLFIQRLVNLPLWQYQSVCFLSISEGSFLPFCPLPPSLPLSLSLSLSLLQHNHRTCICDEDCLIHAV